MNQVSKPRSRRIFATSVAIALVSLGTLLYAARIAGQVPSGTNAHQVRELQEERLAILRTIVDLVEQRRQQGGASMAELVLAKRNVAEAELELSTTQAERVLILEKIVEDARILESQASQLALDNVASQEVALALKADLLRSQVRLEVARAELSGEPNGSGPEQAPAGLTSRTRKDVPLGRATSVEPSILHP
jgi:hypothetical protein